MLSSIDTPKKPENGKLALVGKNTSWVWNSGPDVDVCNCLREQTLRERFSLLAYADRNEKPCGVSSVC